MFVTRTYNQEQKGLEQILESMLLTAKLVPSNRSGHEVAPLPPLLMLSTRHFTRTQHCKGVKVGERIFLALTYHVSVTRDEPKTS